MISRKGGARRGTALIVVLVCMIVASTIVLGALRSSLLVRRQASRELQVEQTQWLLDFGVQHASAKLAADRNYDGESFDVDQLPANFKAAKITIAVLESDAGARQLSVVAELIGPGDLDERTQRSVLLPLNSWKEP